MESKELTKFVGRNEYVLIAVILQITPRSFEQLNYREAPSGRRRRDKMVFSNISSLSYDLLNKGVGCVLKIG